MNPNSTVIDLNEQTFNAAVEDQTPLLIDFWAPWCGPCLMMKPILDEAAGMLQGVARVAKINVDENPRLADAFGIRGIPTLVLIENGKVVDALSGVTPAKTLVDRVRSKVHAKAKAG